MRTVRELTRRNLKIFFKDKGMFFAALITPIILLVLYATFLANVYKDSFASALPEGFELDKSIIDATVGGQLISSLLAVSCVTVAFCSNLLMINDRANGTVKDLLVTPLSRPLLGFSYYLASALSTLIVTFTAGAAGLIYLSMKSWYLSTGDVLHLVLDILLLTLFGTALSSCIHFFMNTSGQASAVGTIISAGYGFICGAYMPISSFSKGLQKVLSFLPGTYGTALLKNHMLRGVFEEMKEAGIPQQAIEGMRNGIDCNLKFFDNDVSITAMYIIVAVSVVVLTCAFIAMNLINRKKKN